jgi:hypothetical protein
MQDTVDTVVTSPLSVLATALKRTKVLVSRTRAKLKQDASL